MPIDPPDSTPRSLFGRFAKAVRGDWRSRARPPQIPPEDFSVLLLLAGRGAGKNWTASNYISEQAASGAVKRIALIGPTANDTRYVMVEGESGVLAAARAAGVTVDYEAGKGLLTWPGGAIARCFSADTPDALRGSEHDLAWTDEVAAWRRAEDTWNNLLLTMRIGTQPRIVATTTPRPIRLIRDLVARDGTDGIVVRRMSTYDNRENLAPQFFAQLVRRFEGTRLARQELLAELLEDVPGALWSRDTLEQTRVESAPKNMQRIVIGVDPAGSSTEGADLTGIVACGIGLDGEGYVLADLSRRGTPREWASAAIAAYRSLKADRIVVERNFGGEMAASTLASVDPTVPVTEVTSSRGKVLRAEPIGSLFEQKRAHIVGNLPELEDQACSFTSDWNRARDGSPDRVDALVFALSELMLGAPAGGFFREGMFLQDGQPVVLTRPPDDVFCVIGTAHETGPGKDSVAILYCCRTKHNGPPLTIIDWDIVPHDVALMSGTWVEDIARKLGAWVAAAHSRNAGIWIERTPIGAPLLELAAAHRLAVYDASEALKDVPTSLPERVNLVARFVGTGRLVRLGADAHAKVITFRGLTRNHFLSQICAYGSTADATQQPVEFLHALAIAALIAFPEDAVAHGLGEPGSAAHVVHGPGLSETAAALATPEPPPRVSMVTLVEQYRIDLAAWQAREREAIEAVRLKARNPTWRPRTWRQLDIGPPPENPAARVRCN